MKRLAASIALVVGGGMVSADPLRLRGDALASAESPAGLLVLDADGSTGSTLSAEALVWMAGQRSPGQDVTGDVLVVVVKARDPAGRANGQIGRFVSTLGALRPLQIDGAGGRVRLPGKIDVEAMVGVPVLATAVDASRTWDWVAGGRIARRIGDGGSIGIAYQQERDAGRLAREEVGADAGFALDARHDVGARIAYDVAGEGLAEVAITASTRRGPLRAEVFAQQRSAAHLLPATSLFTVLGDTPAQRVGTVLTWRAAPRLDVVADLGARHAADTLGEDVALRARLRLDPRGKSSLGCEVHRNGGASDASWTGLRGSAALALPRSFGITAEIEIVRPDEDRGHGTLWPWMLLAATRKSGAWDAAVAVEASATPEYRHRVDALLQLSRTWSTR